MCMTVRQARNEIFSDRIYTFGKAVRVSLTGSQGGDKNGIWLTNTR